MKEVFLELLDQLDVSGPERASHTRVFALTLLRMLSPQDRAQALEFLVAYADPPPAPKRPLRLLPGGLA